MYWVFSLGIEPLRISGSPATLYVSASSSPEDAAGTWSTWGGAWPPAPPGPAPAAPVPAAPVPAAPVPAAPVPAALPVPAGPEPAAPVPPGCLDVASEAQAARPSAR